MQLDLDILLEEATQDTHHGHPVIIETSSTGGRGRPRYVIDRAWLAWARMQRTTSGIAHFLGISRKTVRQALLEYGLVQAGNNPFRAGDSEEDDDGNVASEGPSIEGGSGLVSTLAGENPSTASTDDLLEPDVPFPPQLPSDLSLLPGLAELSEADLDDLLLRLRFHYRRAGVSMLDGMLHRLGYHVPQNKVRESLIRIDPVRRVFE